MVNSSLIFSSIPSCTKQEMENKAEVVLFCDIILSKMIGWRSLLSMQNSGRKKISQKLCYWHIGNQHTYLTGITAMGQIQFHAGFQFPLTTPADKATSSLFCSVCRSLHTWNGGMNVLP